MSICGWVIAAVTLHQVDGTPHALTQHPNYKYTSDYDPKNALDIEKFLNRKEKIHPDDTFIMVDADSLPPA